ncbi:hypothetical protein M2419_002071 [Sphingobacterium sp. BIGb0116]|nr:hypothetical protein [Sphingobacterium sp. BIGb0116]
MLFNLFMEGFNVNSAIGLQDRWNKGPLQTGLVKL